MLLIELNEFNPKLLAQAAAELDLPHIQTVLGFDHSHTSTRQTEERHGLDPWVQWVSIHTGVDLSQHGIEHLGDVKKLKIPQIWEALDKQGVSSGIWGAMNASRGNCRHCRFFLPDPWTFTEQAYPDELNALLGLPRYYSKNYLQLSKTKMLGELFGLIAYCLQPARAMRLLALAPSFAGYLLRYPMGSYITFSLFDLVNAAIFSQYQKKYQPDFNIIFLNSIAHLQHRCWTSGEQLSVEMEAAFKLLDKTLGIILSGAARDEVIIVTNALSQRCSYQEQEFLYRQKNPKTFFSSIGLPQHRLEQLMTNDSHLLFANEHDAMQAKTILGAAMLDGEPAFEVLVDSDDSSKLFCQFIIWRIANSRPLLTVNKQVIDFNSSFEKVVQRSGTHVPHGDVYSTNIAIPGELANHELYNIVLQYYGQVST